MLGAGEGGKPRASAQAGGGSGEQDSAAVTRDHPLGDFPCVQEAGEARHLPDLEVLACGFFQNAARHIGADVEDERFNRSQLGFDLLDQSDHVLFFTCITGKTMGFTARQLNAVYQGLQFVGAATGDAGDVAFAGKAFGYGAACCVTGTHD